MKHQQFAITVILVLLASILSAIVVDAQGPTGGKPTSPRTVMGTAFTYQGQLKQGGSPVSGNCDFQFALWDSQTGGAQIGTTQSKPNISVSGGLFTAQLDYGASAFDGSARYLDIQVSCPAGSGLWAPLSPRQPLTPAPYAVYAAQGPFWSLTGNGGTTPGTNFIGTTDNEPVEFRVNNTRALRLEPNATSPNIVGGYSGNAVDGGVQGATIGGGGAPNGNLIFYNHITGNYGTVAGGQGNTAGFEAAVAGGLWNAAWSTHTTVGGGIGNQASGDASTICGGAMNAATGKGAFVGGGGFDGTNWLANVAQGNGSVVSGGISNTVTGNYGTIAGGAYNTAAGMYSFVAGNRAKNSNASHNGVFLFSDSKGFDFTSVAADEFAVRSTGGVRFVTAINGNGDPIAGEQLAAGGSGWSTISDRNAKANFKDVDARTVLETVVKMPVQTWNYKTQDPSIRHMGPMAQDFYAGFQVGEDDKHINSVDADGVALAAIQGLYQVVQDKDAQLAAQQNEIAQLKKQNADFESRLAALEQLATTNGAPVRPNAETVPTTWVLLGGLFVLGWAGIRRRR